MHKVENVDKTGGVLSRFSVAVVDAATAKLHCMKMDLRIERTNKKGIIYYYSDLNLVKEKIISFGFHSDSSSSKAYSGMETNE